MEKTHEPMFEPDAAESPWPLLGWIVLATLVSIVAFLLAPLP